jgi:peptide/nickel transport system permease protein
MLETLRQDYVRTARAKGVTYWGVLLKHCLPNSLIPLISAMALDIPMLLTGAFMVEIVFTWPGIGRLYIDSFRNGDWPTLMGIVVVSTYLIVFANLLADIAYGIVDPRIRKAA